MKALARTYFLRGASCAVLALLMAAAAPAQRNRDKKNDTSREDLSSAINSVLPDTEVVNRTVSEALGYWQIGDVDSMRKYYADDLVIVSPVWEQPMIGWDNYVRAYQTQRARLTNGRLDRSNTYTKVTGNSAWTTYQWVYTATADGRTTAARGHTTLLLNKQGVRWVIGLEHTSVVLDSQAPGPVSTETGPSGTR